MVAKYFKNNQKFWYFFQCIQELSDNLMVHYLVTKEIAGGIVARRYAPPPFLWPLTPKYKMTSLKLTMFIRNRDYVNLRYFKEKDGVMLSAGCPIQHPDCPPVKKIVRYVL